MLDKINNYIKDYIDNYDLQEHPENINSIRKLNKLILNNPVRTNYTDYKHEIELQTSQELAFEFLNYAGFSFTDCLDPKMKSFNIDFISAKEIEYDKPPHSCIDIEDNSTKIKMYYYNNMSDCYTFIHELFHTMNNVYEDDLVKKYRRNVLTETVSLLAEVEAEKYFLANYQYDEDLKIKKKDIYYAIYVYAIKTRDTLKLVDAYLKKGHVTSKEVANISDDTINEIMMHEELQIPKYSRYLLAYTLVNYIEVMFDGKQMLKNLNSMIKDNKMEYIFKCLNLDVVIKPTDDNLELITDIGDYSLKLLELCLEKKKDNQKVYNIEYKKIHNVS